MLTPRYSRVRLERKILRSRVASQHKHYFDPFYNLHSFFIILKKFVIAERKILHNQYMHKHYCFISTIDNNNNNYLLSETSRDAFLKKHQDYMITVLSFRIYIRHLEIILSFSHSLSFSTFIDDDRRAKTAHCAFTTCC